MNNCKKYILNSSIGRVVIFTFISGIVIHIFGLINVLHNYDDIYYVQGYGAGMSSGRWCLALLGDFAGKIWGNYNIPYINGLVFLFLVSLAAGLIYSIFQLDSWKKGIVIGLILISYPSVTSVLFFKYTAIFYGIAILLSVFAVWSIEKMKYGLGISAISIALAAGIYQAYLPLTISLFVLLLIKYVLENDVTYKEIFLKGISYCISIIVGMAFYFGALKICLKYYKVSLSDYQGVSEMGNLELNVIPSLIKRTLVDFFKLPVSDYCNLASTGVLKIGYLLLGCICIMCFIRQIVVKPKKICNVLMFIMLGILFPIAVNFIVIMCPKSSIYTLMVYSFVVVLIVPIILLNYMKICTRKIVVFLLFIMVGNYVYLTNVNYTAMYYTDRQTENYLCTMVTQIRATEGFNSSQKWAFIGENIEDPLIKNPWANIPIYGGNDTTYINRYSRMAWIEKYLGYQISMEEKDVVDKLSTDERVNEMPCWPNEGSISVIDNTVVIKLENIRNSEIYE